MRAILFIHLVALVKALSGAAMATVVRFGLCRQEAGELGQVKLVVNHSHSHLDNVISREKMCELRQARVCQSVKYKGASNK